MSEAQKIIDALKSENESIKKVLEVVNAQKDALDQTVREILSANIALKAGSSILEKRIKEQEDQLKSQTDDVFKLSTKLNQMINNLAAEEEKEGPQQINE